MEVNEAEPRAKSKSPNKHMLWMILCCLIPIIAIVALKAAGVQNAVLSFAVVLICPISMVLMMVLMMKKSGDGNGHQH
jgi:heme/copper-type cytochrome/quinol oxidase subunit 4